MRARSVLFNLPLVVSATPIDAPFTHNSRSTDASSILWKSCTIPIATSVPVECGSLNVPLDYTEKNSSETLRLDLVRIPAVQLEKKGSILFNFGGPGADGVVDLGYYSEPLLAYASHLLELNHQLGQLTFLNQVYWRVLRSHQRRSQRNRLYTPILML